METTTTNGAPDLQARLQDPQTRAALTRLLDRLDTIDRAVDVLERLEAQLPGGLSTAMDIVDAELTAAADRGVVLDERVGEALSLAEKLTEPRTASALHELLDRLDRLAPLIEWLDAAPEALAMATDVFDDEVRRLHDAGVDPEQGLRDALGALGRLAALFRTDEFRALLDSGVLDPRTLKVIGRLGTALVETQDEAARGETPSRGLFGLLGALRDDDVRRTIGFLTRFAQTFGRQLR